MIYSFFDFEDPILGTIVKTEDGLNVVVSMTEEELFRGVLGNEEFERRLRKAVLEVLEKDSKKVSNKPINPK